MAEGKHIVADNRGFVEYAADPGWDFSQGYPTGEEAVWIWEARFSPVEHIVYDKVVGPHRYKRERIGVNSKWSLPQKIAGNAITGVEFVYKAQSEAGVVYEVKVTYEDGTTTTSPTDVTVPRGQDGKDADGASNPAPSQWFDTIASMKAFTGYVDGAYYGVFEDESVYVYSASSTVGVKPDDNNSPVGRYVKSYSFAGQFATTADIDAAPMTQAAKAMTPYLLQYWYENKGVKNHIDNTSIHFADAPSDGTIYGRKDGAWTAAASSLDELTDVTAPSPNDTDGLYYNTNTSMWETGRPVYFKQGPDLANSQSVQVSRDGRITIVLSGSDPISLIDTAGLVPGDTIKLIFDEAGQVISHRFDKTTLSPAPPNLATLEPIWLQLLSNYTTTEELEPFYLTLIERPNGDRYWLDVNHASKIGSVEPDFYVAERVGHKGFNATVTTSVITGFDVGETSSAVVYGDATWTPGMNNNTLVCTGAGVLTSIEVSGEKISFGTGLKAGNTGVGIAYPSGRKLYLENAGAIGNTDSGLYEEHFIGFIDCGSDVTILGTDLINV